MVTEYRESEAYKADLIDGNLEATKIGFNCLYHRLVSDHPSIDLLCYPLAKLLKVPIPDDDITSTCLPTSGPSVHSSEALLIIHKD